MKGISVSDSFSVKAFVCLSFQEFGKKKIWLGGVLRALRANKNKTAYSGRFGYEGVLKIHPAWTPWDLTVQETLLKPNPAKKSRTDRAVHLCSWLNVKITQPWHFSTSYLFILKHAVKENLWLRHGEVWREAVRRHPEQIKQKHGRHFHTWIRLCCANSGQKNPSVHAQGSIISHIAYLLSHLLVKKC